MAQQVNQTHKVKFRCSICLDPLKDPVTIPCGHNYCMSCIQTHWDQEDQKKIHSCPQCGHTFSPRPVLVKNTMLAELVEELKKTGLLAAPADHCYAGPGDVACDVCTGRKLKASKSCLQCLASYCEQHLQPHSGSPAFEKHKLIKASAMLQENICPEHEKLNEMFCCTDQQCICSLCLINEHKGHDTVSVEAERTEKQKELGESRKKIQQRVQDREKDLKELQQEMENINLSADKAVEYSERMFMELICLIKNTGSNVKQQVRFRQTTEVSRLKDLQEKLDQEITELKRKDAELEQLSHTEDHAHFLYWYPSLSGLPVSKDSSRPNIYCLQYFKDVMAAVAAARDKMQAVVTRTWRLAEPTRRAEFLQYSREITLDPNTASRCLVLSKGNRKITYNRLNIPHPEHPDRFIHRSQVLSKDALTGRCYWEVEMSRYVGVAVAYKSISRSGNFDAFAFGYNDKSWALYCYNMYAFKRNNQTLSIPGPKSTRIGVYLDHRAGILSFYSISETMTLLHRVQTTFTEPLYAGLYLYSLNEDSAEFCSLRPLKR